MKHFRKGVPFEHISSSSDKISCESILKFPMLQLLKRSQINSLLSIAVEAPIVALDAADCRNLELVSIESDCLKKIQCPRAVKLSDSGIHYTLCKCSTFGNYDFSHCSRLSLYHGLRHDDKSKKKKIIRSSESGLTDKQFGQVYDVQLRANIFPSSIQHLVTLKLPKNRLSDVAAELISGWSNTCSTLQFLCLSQNRNHSIKPLNYTENLLKNPVVISSFFFWTKRNTTLMLIRSLRRKMLISTESCLIPLQPICKMLWIDIQTPHFLER